MKFNLIFQSGRCDWDQVQPGQEASSSGQPPGGNIARWALFLEKQWIFEMIAKSWALVTHLTSDYTDIPKENWDLFTFELLFSFLFQNSNQFLCFLQEKFGFILFSKFTIWTFQVRRARYCNNYRGREIHRNVSTFTIWQSFRNVLFFAHFEKIRSKLDIFFVKLKLKIMAFSNPSTFSNSETTIRIADVSISWDFRSSTT